jgi:hypothetical protein
VGSSSAAACVEDQVDERLVFVNINQLSVNEYSNGLASSLSIATASVHGV